jgi:RNA chaperone Hfq
MQMVSEDFINSLEYNYIDNLIKNQSLVSVYLKNSIRLKGYILAQDEESILLRQGATQLIFKAKISTVLPEMVFSSWSQPISA